MTEQALAVMPNIEDIKKYIAPKATDKELFMFMGICNSYGLNPFKREIHFVKYGDNPASIIVGYEIYLKRAERTGKLDGWKCWIETDKIGEKAVIEIDRKDRSKPTHWEVYRKEFDKQQSTWKSMPTFMLKKVAIAQGFRLAFPDDLGGMPYIPEELPHTGSTTSETLPQGNVVEGETVPETEPQSESQEKSLTGTSLNAKNVYKMVCAAIEPSGVKEFCSAWTNGKASKDWTQEDMKAIIDNLPPKEEREPGMEGWGGK